MTSFFSAQTRWVHIHSRSGRIFHTETHLKKILPLNERSPSRSSSSPPAEAGLVGMVVWITGTTSLPPRRSNKSFAYGRRTANEQDNVKNAFVGGKQIKNA